MPTPTSGSATTTVRVSNPDNSWGIDSRVDVYAGLGTVIIADGTTPIARIHGAYAQAGLGQRQLATAVGQDLLLQSRLAPDAITDMAMAASVPNDQTTFLGPSVRDSLGLSVTRPVHVNTLCTSGAEAIARVLELIARRGGGFGMVLGADDQSLGQIALANHDFREILARVSGRQLPMQFGLALEASNPQHDFAKKFGITPDQFAEAVALYVEQHGRLPGYVSDGIMNSFRDPIADMYMWDTAAEIARRWGVTDEDAIAIGIASHQRYFAAHDAGVFEGTQVLVPGTSLRHHQNPVRGADARLVGRGKTAPGVGSGSSSQMGGAGAGLILTGLETARSQDLPVLAEIVGYSFSSVPPEVMGLGPVAASKGLLQYLGLSMKDMAHIELNEAFAAVSYAFMHEADFGLMNGGASLVLPDRLNPWGGAIATGHVMGSKFIEMVALANRHFELHPNDQYALVTLCGGGGQGAAMVLRNPRFIAGVKPGSARGMSEPPTDHYQKQIWDVLIEAGYLPTERLRNAIRNMVAHASGRESWHFPTADNVRFVLEKRGTNLSPEDLLKQAFAHAAIRFWGDNHPNYETIGKIIGIVGSGEMGRQLAMDYARAGYEVVIADLTVELASMARIKITDTLFDAVGRGLYTPEEAGKILRRIQVSGSMVGSLKRMQEEGRSFEMVIEAATEKLELKQRIFAELRAVANPNTILATNSSSLTAAQTGADAVFHYFNPVHAMNLIDGTFADGLPQEKQDRLAAIAANTRKLFLPLGKDVPGSLVNPFFAATYFAAGMLPELEVNIRLEAEKKLLADGLSPEEKAALSDMKENPRRYALALLDGFYVEAIRGESKPLAQTLSKSLDSGKDGDLGKALRRGGQGLFRLIGNTGGPKPYVETADNVSVAYGSHLVAPEALRNQLAAWESGDKWNWLPPMDNFEYDTFVRGGIHSLQAQFGDLVERVRGNFHRRFWANVLHLMGTMYDRDIVSTKDADKIENGVGVGLGWSNTPGAWFAAQPDFVALQDLLVDHDLTIPEFLTDILKTVLLRIETVKLGYSHGGHVAKITINRPRVLNAVDENVIGDLERHAQAVATNGEVSMVVLQGAGKNFVAGADLKWFKARQDESARLRDAGDEEGAQAELAKIHDAFAKREIDAMATLNDPKRLRVAVVQGMNIGGGVEMIAQADIVIILEGPEGEGAKFWMPEASLGIGIGYGAHTELVRKVGEAHAKRILLTGAGATFGSQEALQMGFANRIVRRDQLPQVLDELLVKWEAARDQAITKEDFIRSWTGERPKPSPRLKAKEELWSDPFAVKTMALGEVPKWLEGDTLTLAKQEVGHVRRGSPEAIELLDTMVDEGAKTDLRRGLTRIFDTRNARAGVAGRARGFAWPMSRAHMGRVNAIAATRLTRLGLHR
ncbi:MAG TPA: hypothetical protein DDW49_08105 [Deltaproteobacteria bacterium]|nr:hypothetical protein [Deltaproteobacteria bacterium]